MMNSGFTKLSPYKKDPKQRATIKVQTVADRLIQRPKKPTTVGSQ